MAPETTAPRTEPEPDARVYFAAERTFLSWIRTGLAMMGFGFVVARFGLFLKEMATVQGAPETAPGWSLWFGTGLILLGVALTAASAVSHVGTVRRFNRGEAYVGRPTWTGVIVAILLSLVGLLMTLYLALLA